ncbi:hypothetical protein FEM48_Zijuj03G0187000 [Ziziphus jujuba var. spinosa]|uniref:RPW8 domain-containing protein n=1 Tax=Ziziphus jujuba var. spinosa TaxID=714518 RepID=A0A978VRZ4_ZIZJJ|nr:hypothetical protein FEM48_Zijuj03G0187000 [Ziziphus jujuba var. spinosa]
MAEALGWTALGALLERLFQEVTAIVVQNIMIKKTLKNIATKLETLKPLVEEIKKLNQQLAEPIDECEHYESLIKDGVDLVRKCSSIGKGYYYAEQLKELDRTLEFLVLFVYSTRHYQKILIQMHKASAETQEQQGTSIGQPYQDTSQNHDVGQGWNTCLREAVRSLLDVIKESKNESRRVETALNKLKTTLQSLQARLIEIERLNMELGLPDCRAAFYKHTIHNGVGLVRNCSQVHGFKSLTKKIIVTIKLRKLNNYLQDLDRELPDHA